MDTVFSKTHPFGRAAASEEDTARAVKECEEGEGRLSSSAEKASNFNKQWFSLLWRINWM